jgi:sugar-specific transcriptional regulator TrmB
MKDISPILKSLGFLDSEIKTYMAALQNGPGTVLDITKKTKLSRQATYTAIESLIVRGIMSTALVGKKRFYASERPDKLLAYARRHEEEVAEMVKDLSAAVPELELVAGGEKLMVRSFEGREGLKAFIDDVRITKPKDVYEIADLKAVSSIFNKDDLKPVQDELIKLGTKRHFIYSGDPFIEKSAPNRYFLPPEVNGFKTDLIIYGDKIAFVTFEGKINTVIVESAALARTIKIVFNMALEEAKKTLVNK